ncbi:Conserved oligomeric Golgi complex subunit 6 [Nymphon striatum]|nr:Conserved oligomeric Golgi complex subunit 6 [Nymphon striatum]
MQGSGWVQALVQAEIATAGSADSFIRASHVLRTRRAHQVTAAALYILQHRADSHYCLGQTRDAEDLSEFESWCYQRGKDIPQFHYWATMLELELLLLVYVRSLRQGSLMMYIEALTELVPWFYALDRTHYARWIPVHLKDMAKLTTKHPDVAKKFKESHFTVQKTQRAFSSIPIDQAHEQNNACIKGDGGAVGLTDNPSALRRWMVAGPEVARVIEEFQDVGQHCRQKKADTRHYDQTPSVQTSFVKDVRSLVDVIEEMGNPFEEESQDVVKLSTAPRDIPDNAMSIIERFVILLYDRTSKCTDIDKARRKLFAKRTMYSSSPQRKQLWMNISRGQPIKVDMCGVKYCCQHQSSLHQPTGVGQELQKGSTHLTGLGMIDRELQSSSESASAERSTSANPLSRKLNKLLKNHLENDKYIAYKLNNTTMGKEPSENKEEAAADFVQDNNHKTSVQDTLEALKTLSVFFNENNLRTRRNLRGDVERRSLAINEEYVEAFKAVKEKLDDLHSDVTSISNCCNDMTSRLKANKTKKQNNFGQNWEESVNFGDKI